MTLEKITPQFIEKILKKWQKGDFSTEDLESLNFSASGGLSVDARQLHLREVFYQRVQDNLSDSFLIVVASQNRAGVFQELRKLFQFPVSDRQYFALIHLRYLDIRKYTVGDLADEIGVSVRTLRRYLLKGFERLSIQIRTDFGKKEFLAGKSLQDYFPIFVRNQVINIDDILAKINACLLDTDNAPSAISIEGIGGIGKTLIAKYLLQEQYQKSSFEGYAWVSASQKELSPSGEIASVDDFATTLHDVVARLAYQLGQNHLAGLSTQGKLDGLKKIANQKSFLIVIDNLETLHDVDELVPELLKLTGKSKLLFTSRKSLRRYPNVHTVQISELSFEDSYTLVDREIKRLGLALPLSKEMMNALYQVIGGIPLVLKLATAQFGFVPVKDIVHQLRLGKDNAQNMYTYIYQQAWTLLNDTAKSLLLSMLNVSSDGENRQWICEMGGFSESDFSKGLEQLKRLSLIEFSGTIEEPLYRIHRLTDTFLRTDILDGWEDNSFT